MVLDSRFSLRGIVSVRGDVSPSELPSRYLRRSQVSDLQLALARVQAQMHELGQEIGESGSTTWFSGESEVNVLRDEMRRLMREEDLIRAELALPMFDDEYVDNIHRGLDREGIVRLGSTVLLEIDGMEELYTIVGASDARVASGRISSESPVGSALLGKRAGEDVTVEAPQGEALVYRIVRVEA